MKLKIEKGIAEGRVTVPPSKSVSHRMLICGALSENSTIRNLANNDDISATLSGLANLGAVYHKNDDSSLTIGGLKFNGETVIDCNESGSTIRFLIPLALLSENKVKFIGAERLLKRPMGIYEDICKKQGLTYVHTDSSITVCGKLKSDNFVVPGNISSQFITGLLFALPLLKNDSTIEITDKFESKSYIDITIDVMKKFGVIIEWICDNKLYIKGGQKYNSCDVCVEGDWSAAAFWYGLNAIGGKVEINELNKDSYQGDKVCVDILKNINEPQDLSDCPDLAPILFAVAAAKGGGRFEGTKRLQLKESDRAGAMRDELGKFGASVIINDNSVDIKCVGINPPKEVLYAHNDHRIAMALAVLCTLTGGEIEGYSAVSKSYPSFFEELSKLGIKVTK